MVGSAILWAIYPANPLLLFPLALAAIAATLATRLGWIRPASDVIAWGAAVLLVATLPGTTRVMVDVQTLLLSILAVTGIVAGVHIPLRRSAQPGPTMGLPVWLLIVTFIALAAWWPVLRPPQGDVIVWDPLSPVGAAIRILGVLVLFALVSGILSATSLIVRSSKEQDVGGQNPEKNP